MRILCSRRSLATLAGLVCLTAAATPLFAKNNSNGDLTIYLTRHAEKETLLIDAPPDAGLNGFYQLDENRLPMLVPTPNDDEGNPENPKGVRQDQVCYVDKCAEILSDKGELRAMLLAEWFQQKGIVRKLDAIFATHKIRTQQTVEPTAVVADLDVQPIPATGTELDPESTKPTVCATLDAIRTAQNDGMDTILVAGHSGTLYTIMGEGRDECAGMGLGLDVSDDERFPKDEDGKVRDFGDVWKVVLARRRKCAIQISQKPATDITSSV